MKKILFSAAIIATSLVSCTSEADDAPIAPKYPTVSEITLSRSEQYANEDLNKFGIDFYAATAKTEINDKQKNFAISPVSLALGFSIWANMNSDQSANEIAGWFDCDDLSTLNSLSNKLMRFLPDKVNKNEMVLANSVWHMPQFEPTKDFTELMASNFYADVIAADLMSPNSKNIIQEWISNNTRGLIKDVNIQPSEITFANALYFKSEWGVKFDKSKTKKETFRSPLGDREVMMMHAEANMKHYDGNGFDMLTIPYNGNNEFIAIRPNESVDFNAFAQSLNYETFKSAIERSTVKSIELSMPRFESSVREADCRTVLEQMGIEMPATNLTGMLGRDYHSAVKIDHYAKVITDEVGTEAASLTIGFIWSGSGNGNYKPEKQVFTLDRPFIYLIRNTKTGSIIMAGQYVQPE